RKLGKVVRFVLAREIGVFYQSFLQNKADDLPKLPIQYADFAVWQRQWLQGNVLASQLGYWKKKLDGELPLLRLPTDRPRPAIQSRRGATESFTLEKELSERVNKLGQRYGVTLFTTLLASFKTLLYRYTGQEDIVVGTHVANRNRTETEGLIGYFLNGL